LTNVLRHSQSKAVEITFENNGTEAKLKVRDFGRGIAPEIVKRMRQDRSYVGVGLMGMRERVAEFGGRFEVSSDAHGTQVEVALPLTRAAR
jgi:two-component system, NarL family, sensor kinase